MVDEEAYHPVEIDRVFHLYGTRGVANTKTTPNKNHKQVQLSISGIDGMIWCSVNGIDGMVVSRTCAERERNAFILQNGPLPEFRKFDA